MRRVSTAVAVLWAGAVAAQPVAIGSVAAANRDVLGTPPGLTQRQLNVGVEINAEERIETAELGAGQFLFLDQTTLNVWPNSDIVLDRFVYDPGLDRGDISMTMTRGFLRFIGGRVSKQTDAEVATPNGFVFIRGGIAQVEVGQGVTRAVHIAGEYTRLNEIALSRPNAAAEARVGPDGTVETVFLGVLSAAEVQALFGRPPGRGNGGLDTPPDDAFARNGIEAAGLDRLGSRDAQAARAEPVSTLGERDRSVEPATVFLPDPPRMQDRQVPLAVAFVEAVNGTVDGQPIVRPVTPPEEPPDDTPEATPLLGLAGALFAAGPAEAFAPDGDGAALAGFAALTLDGRAAVLGAVAADDGADAVDAPVAMSGRFLRLPATTGGALQTGAGLIDGRAARADTLVDPGVFHLGAFAATSGAPATALGFFGAPTPAAVWAATGAPRTIDYAATDALFTGATAPLPGAAGLAVEGTLRFTLLSGADGAFVDPAAPQAAGTGRVLGAYLAIEGTGADQRSALGIAAGALGRSAAGAPVFGAPLSLSSRLDAAGGLGRGLATLGSLATPGGQSAFGAAGDWLVVGAAAPFAADGDPALDAAPGRFSDAPGAADVAYGDTRAARRSGGGAVAADRAPLGLAVGSSAFAGTADPRVSTVLTGGYAMAAAQSHRPAAAAGAQVSDPFLLLGRAPSTVAVGFAPADNGVAVELAGLEPLAGGAGLSGVRLAFGDLDGADALADDGRFTALAVGRGALTGAAPAASGQALRADGDRPHGGLASRAVAGEGGVFPAGVDADPEYLRWGWWNGEVAFAAATADPAFAGRTDRLHLGAWVGGVVSDIADVRAQTGTAGYDGFAVAQVVESGAAGPVAYVEGGRFSMTFDFDASAGTATVAGILGETVSFAVDRNGAIGADHFGAAAATGFVNGPGSGTLSGSFFTGEGSPVRAAAGSFALDATAPSGRPATAAGVFGADRTP